MTPKSDPGRLRRRSRRQVAARSCLGSSFGSFLDPPEPQKLSSRLGAVPFFMNLRFPLGHAKTIPKSSKNNAPNLPRRPPEGPKCGSKAMLDWSSNFKRCFDDFWSQNGPSRTPQNHLKMRFFGTWAPRPPQRPPGSLQEAILEPFWTIIGAIFVPK